MTRHELAATEHSFFLFLFLFFAFCALPMGECLTGLSIDG
jgi:hypothetical protein